MKKEHLTIVKVGGAIVEDASKLKEFLNAFAAIPDHKILVHGGGRSATKFASSLGIQSKMVEGRRITDANMLQIVTMVYGGLVNKNLVAKLQSMGLNALGLTGADMNIIHSHKRPLVKGVDFGFVGDIDQVNAYCLQKLIQQGVIPVIAPLTHDGKGQMLNTNADTIAAETAQALARFDEVTLVYSFEKDGVLRDPDNEHSVISTITRPDFNQYVAAGIVEKGMIPKLQNALCAVDQGVKEVIITKYSALDGKHGTLIHS